MSPAPLVSIPSSFGTASAGSMLMSPSSPYQSSPLAPSVTPPMRQPLSFSSAHSPSGLSPSCSHSRSEQIATSMNSSSSSVLERMPPPSSEVRMPFSRQSFA